MNAVMFSTWIAMGLLTGWLANIVMKDGGHGLVRDLVLGVIGASGTRMPESVKRARNTDGQWATAAQ